MTNKNPVKRLEKKTALGELKRKKQLYEAIVKNAPEGVVFWGRLAPFVLGMRHAGGWEFKNLCATPPRNVAEFFAKRSVDGELFWAQAWLLLCLEDDEVREFEMAGGYERIGAVVGTDLGDCTLLERRAALRGLQAKLAHPPSPRQPLDNLECQIAGVLDESEYP